MNDDTYIPCAPEWEAHFRTPEREVVTHPVAFWVTHPRDGIAAFCPTYGYELVRPGMENFIGFWLNLG